MVPNLVPASFDRRSVRRFAMRVALASSLCACTAERTPVAANPALPGSAQQVEARVGDATVYAVALQTSSIPAEVARTQGIERRADLIMLRVSARNGSEADLRSAPVAVQATVTGLDGRTRPLQVREAEAGGLIDHVALVDAELPDTLRFDIRVATPGGASETLRLTREFYPE